MFENLPGGCSTVHHGGKRSRGCASQLDRYRFTCSKWPQNVPLTQAATPPLATSIETWLWPIARLWTFVGRNLQSLRATGWKNCSLVYLPSLVVMVRCIQASLGGCPLGTIVARPAEWYKWVELSDPTVNFFVVFDNCPPAKSYPSKF
jgi:hypothetical protein